MLIEEVKKLSPKERLLYWIRERQQIYLKRKAGKQKPWTNDQILQSYRFCNVIRIQDKVSQWLLHNWYLPKKNHKNMLLACTLARQLNNPEALDAVMYPDPWAPNQTMKILEERAARGLGNYNAAYMITGRYGKKGREPETKAYQTVYRVCQPIYESKLRVDTSSMEKTHRSLLKFPGFRSFISGQVVADLRWAMDGEWKDKMTWAPIGPGSQRGLNRYLHRPYESKIEESIFQRELLQIFESTQSKLGVPSEIECMDLQGCLCEFDKYERVMHGEGRPKRRFQGAAI